MQSLKATSSSLCHEWEIPAVPLKVKSNIVITFCRSSDPCQPLSLVFFTGNSRWPYYPGLCHNGSISHLSPEVTLNFEILIKLAPVFILFPVEVPMAIPRGFICVIDLGRRTFDNLSLHCCLLFFQTVPTTYTGHTGSGNLHQRNLDLNICFSTLNMPQVSSVDHNLPIA